MTTATPPAPYSTLEGALASGFATSQLHHSAGHDLIQGEVFDVAVDLRRSSPNFGKWTGVTLSADNKKQLWVPEGFAHGFVVLSETAEFLYKTTDFYAPEHERSLLWNDPAIGINWPFAGQPTLAAKDAAAITLGKAETFE